MHPQIYCMKTTIGGKRMYIVASNHWYSVRVYSGKQILTLFPLKFMCEGDYPRRPNK